MEGNLIASEPHFNIKGARLGNKSVVQTIVNKEVAMQNLKNMNITETTAGKVGVGVFLAALLAMVFYFMNAHSNSIGESRVVTAQEATKNAQDAIAAINKMNIPQAQKDALIAHQQAAIATATGSQTATLQDQAKAAVAAGKK
jgi:hypothetical protein